MRIAARYLVGAALALGIASAGIARSAAEGRAARGAQQTATPGQTLTRLPDGRWLMIGGEVDGQPSAAARILDPVSGAARVMTLPAPRAWHTATVLADGTVLITGGSGSGGQFAAGAEIVDPATMTVMPFSVSGTAPRTGASATLLTDGRVLIAGGHSANGQPPRTEIWDLERGLATPIGAGQARSGHTASLLPDGRVRVTGGQDAAGRARSDADIIDPADGRVTPTLPPPASDGSLPALSGSLPEDAATGVAIDARLALRFSKPLALATVDGAIALVGPDGRVDATVVTAEGGRLVFVTAASSLLPATVYTLSIDGALDEAGVRLARAAISFTTQAADTPTVADSDPEGWLPDRANGWRTNRPESPWRQLPPLIAPPGTTALSGQVLRLNGKPLADVTLEIDGHATRSDRSGRFLLLLPDVGSGWRELEIDGRSANRPQRTYGTFEYGLAVTSGQTTVLPFTIWMPLIDTAHQVTIASPTAGETVITTPYISGLELHLPRGTTIRDEDGQTLRTVSLTPIPVDRPPFPLPRNVDVPIYFTIQPGGAYVSTPSSGYGRYGSGAWLVYPNYRHEFVGKRIQFYHYEPRTSWYVYGMGTVMAGGAQVMPDAKTRIHQFTGAMINSGPAPPNDGNAPDCCPTNKDADPVGLATGLFDLEQVDLYVPDTMPIAVRRTYRSRDPEVRPFGPGTTHPYAMFLHSEHQYTEADLVLPDGAKLHYIRTSGGLPTSFADAVFEHVERPNPPQGEVATSATPTAFYRSIMRWNGRGWDLTLRDGTVYVFGENAPLQAIRDRFGNTVTISHTFDQMGNVTRVTSPHGRWIEFSYNGNLITQIKDNIGRTVGYQYDANGNLWKVTDPMGQVTEYSYNADHNMTTIKNRNGVVFVTNEYTTAADAPTPIGWVKKQTFADSGFYTFAYTFTSGKVSQTDVTDPLGATRRVTFNPDGYVLQDTRALNRPEQQITTVVRPSTNNFVGSTTDPRLLQTTMTYDDVGNVRSVTRLANTVTPQTTYTYEPRYNQLKTVEDPLHHVTTYDYDDVGNLTRIVDPLQHSVTFGYNTQGQQTSITDALQHSTTFGYLGGDLTTIIDPLNRVTTRFTDAAGRLLRVTNPLGETVRYTYDANDQVTTMTDAANGQTAFDYFPDGQLRSLTNANQQTTRYTLDVLGRVASRTDPLQHTETFVYDRKGRLSEHTNRNGQLTVRTHDAHGRLATMTFADQSTITHTRDAAGRLTAVQDSVNGNITRGFDDLDRLTSETTPRGTIAYSYDAAGRRETATVTGQPSIVYSYDAANRLTTIAQAGVSTGLEYDDAGRRVRLTLPNGSSAEYEYDAASQVTSIVYKYGGTTLGALTYAYDLAGRRIQMDGSFARTGLPQPQPSNTYDAANRLVSYNGARLSYDEEGHLRSAALDDFTWNPRGQLTGTSAASATFAYDGLGRRVSKTSAGATTAYLYDGSSIVQELSGGSPVASRLLGADIDESFARTGAAGAVTPLTDILGSTIAETDATGAITASYTYEPFGRASVSGVPSGEAASFTGREDDGTGLYFYRARYYSPQLQRFVSEDPIGMLESQPDSYLYAGNNPLSFRDPLGLQMTPAQCAELLQDILRKTQLLKDLIAKYDPVSDAQGGWYSRRKRGPTVPGGHYSQIIQLQLRILKDIGRYEKECGPDDPDLPPCREVAKRPVQVPEIAPPGPVVPPGEQLVPLAGLLMQLLLRLAPVLVF